MAKNYYFENFENSMEQNLIEDLVIESIRIYGMDVWYIPRTLVGKDDILNEDDISTFNDAYMAEMYVKSVDGFEGEGDFLSKFGLEIRDSITMTIAKRTYESEVGGYEENTRPLEGDIIYLPLNNKMFEIQHVEHESIFYQMGSLQTYDLRAELFEYSGERFNTGQRFIDTRFDGVNQFTSLVASENTYSVQVNDGYQFYIKDSDQKGAVLLSQAVELKRGVEYTFDQSHESNKFARLSIYNTGTTTEATGVTTSGTLGSAGAYTKFTPPTTGTYEYKALNGSTQYNIVLHSGDIEAGIGSGWTLANSTVTGSNQVDPLGANNAVTIELSSLPSAVSTNSYSSPSPDGIIGSIYVKNSGPGLKLQVVNGENVTQVGAEMVIPQSTSWQRIEIRDQSFTHNNATLRVLNSSGVASSVTIWGAMMQVNGYSISAQYAYQNVVTSYSATELSVDGQQVRVIEVPTDALSDNTTFENFIDKNTGVASDNIIDFSQSNPFGEDIF